MDTGQEHKFQAQSSNSGIQASNTSQKERAFDRHDDSVLCCSVDSQARLVATGGLDDRAIVWDLKTQHVIFEVAEHQESVVAVAFNRDASYVASGDLNGHIVVRNTKTGLKIVEYDIDEVNWIVWNLNSEYDLIAGTTGGEFYTWNVHDPSLTHTFHSYGSSTTAARLVPNSPNIILAYADGAVRMFDLKQRKLISQINHPNRPEIISVDLSPNGGLFAIGCIDGTIELITLGTFKVVGKILCQTPENSAPIESQIKNDESGNDNEQEDTVPNEPVEVLDEYNTCEDPDGMNEEDEEDDDDEDSLNDDPTVLNSVESVKFSPCGTYLAVSNNSGSNFILDVATQKIRCIKHTGIGVTRSIWTWRGTYITACLDGTLRGYDINLGQTNELHLHDDQILDMACTNQFLVTASEDKTCRVIELP